MELSSHRLGYNNDVNENNNGYDDDDGDIHRNQILKEVEEFR